MHFQLKLPSLQVQNLIDNKLSRRMRGIYGPKGNKKMIIFIDDLNLPKPEQYGATPCIELLRQCLDQGGWYDLHEKIFKKIHDIQFVYAMGPTGGGKNKITDRFLRHITSISITPFNEHTLQLIFTKILSWHMDHKEFASDMNYLCAKIIIATNEIFQLVTSKLLPTPAKSHYTFNLRDFSAVIQGLCLSHGKYYTEKDKLIRLWIHEVYRVFGDRLINESDSLQFLKWIRNNVKRNFNCNFDEICSYLDNNDDGEITTLSEIRSLTFGDYLTRTHDRPYIELSNINECIHVWSQYLIEYNEEINDNPMKLVMFKFAVEHASRIARILKTAGNALLVGIGGIGKQSLTKLAAYVMQMDIFQVTTSKTYSIDDWKNDLRTLLTITGAEGKATVFIY